MEAIQSCDVGRNLVLRLKKALIGCVFLAIAPCAAADAFYVVAGFDCKPSQGRLEVWFRGYTNDAGDSAVKNLPPDGFYADDLVEFDMDDSGRYLIKEKPLRRVCTVGKERYLIDISPQLAAGFHPEGRCAARRGARIQVRLRGQLLVDEGTDGCEEDGELTTRVVVQADRKPVITRIPADRFYEEWNRAAPYGIVRP